MVPSFMDCAMPVADDFPFFHTVISEPHAPGNPLGVCAGCKGGTTRSLAAYINAIIDASAETGSGRVEMPARPETIWRAIQCARRHS